MGPEHWKNMPVWREKTGSSAFLLRFGSGDKTEVWSCELKREHAGEDK